MTDNETPSASLSEFSQLEGDPFERRNPGPAERPRRRAFFLAVFGFAVFLVFLVMKLPEARIRNLIIAHIRIFAQEQGLSFSAEKVRIGILMGPTVKIHGAELKSVDDEKQNLKIPYVRIRPRLFSLLTSMKTASIHAELLDGTISGAAGASPSAIKTELELRTLNLGQAALLRKFLGLQVEGKINGTLKILFDHVSPQKSDGKIRLFLDGIAVPAQAYMGFNLPQINIVSAHVDAGIAGGKLVINEFNVGKDIKAEDLVAKVTGDVILAGLIDQSRVNIKAVFEISNRVITAFPLLDALIGTAKGSDGKYTYRISGVLSALEPSPGG
ncbi:MAG: type II secretion system protein GspN [Deltaproteobacteria bacterium]|nr:type II secretion system protein GspN [Deltaproteobacteria bacterium]